MRQSIKSGSNVTISDMSICNQILTEKKIVARIKWEVRIKVIIATENFKMSQKNIALYDSWGMHVKILI